MGKSKMWKPVSVAVLSAGLFLPAGVFAQEAPSSPFGWMLIDPLDGNQQSELVGISEDGMIAVGNSVNPVQKAFTLSPADPVNTVMDIGMPDPTSFRPSATLTTISHDGSTIIGQGSHKLSEQFQINEAARWTEAGGWTFLGTLYQENSNGGSKANGVSRDGRFIVGDSTIDIPSSDQFTAAAFLWTEAGGMVALASLPSGEQAPYGSAGGVNQNGSIIVGTSAIDRPGGLTGSGNHRPVFWTAPDQVHQLPLLAREDQIGDEDFYIAIANLVSDDGNIIAGVSPQPGDLVEVEGLMIRPMSVVRWQRTSPNDAYLIEDLGQVTVDQLLAIPTAMNATGTVIVGAYLDNLEGSFAGFRWTETTGFQDIFDWLGDGGVAVAPEAFSSVQPKGVNGDGSIIVGQVTTAGESQQLLGFIATAEGLILPDRVVPDLNSIAFAFDAIHIGSLLQHGAHGNPMNRRIASDTGAVWAAGDLGRDDHGTRDGSLSLAEIGYARHLENVQLNVSVGTNWADQSLPINGDVDADGLFLTAEAIFALQGYDNLFATLGAFRQWGEVSVKRGYLNAGVPDSSRGKADTDSWGARLRIDAVDAYKKGQTTFTPYADLSYQRTRIEGFTETGGGFPATFNERTDTRFAGRLGLNAVHPLNERVDLTANGEVAHLFDNDGARTSGQIAGLMSFNFANTKLKETWVKGGIGLKADIEGGALILNANATSQGAMPSGWLAASYMIGL